jgi:hypothetical protein
MMMVSFVLRSGRSVAQRLPDVAALIVAEYDRAMLAESRFRDLKGRDPADLRRRRIGPGGISRAVFEAVYASRWNDASGPASPGRPSPSRQTRPTGVAAAETARHGAARAAALGGRRTMRKTTLWAISLALAMPALAADSTPYAMGGVTRKFAPKVREADRSGELFRIRGHCQSACTMFLAVRNVCIEPSAQLLFHAAKTERGTRDMINAYNARLRAYLLANRIMESSAFHTISGSDMIRKFGYRPCP